MLRDRSDVCPDLADADGGRSTGTIALSPLAGYPFRPQIIRFESGLEVESIDEVYDYLADVFWHEWDVTP